MFSSPIRLFILGNKENAKIYTINPAYKKKETQSKVSFFLLSVT